MWFENNFMKLNQDKGDLLVFGYKNETVCAKIGEMKIWESNKQKLLGVAIFRNLNFDVYVFDLCKKAGRKLSVLARLSRGLEFSSYEIELPNRVTQNDVTLGVTNSKIFIGILILSY